MPEKKEKRELGRTLEPNNNVMTKLFHSAKKVAPKLTIARRVTLQPVLLEKWWLL